MIVEKFIESCHDLGLNVTYQRIMVYKILEQRMDHPSAEKIHKDIIKEYPTISLATVYKTLETFVDHNLISKITFTDDVNRYDASTILHYHVICVNCNKILDLETKYLDGLSIPEPKHDKYKILKSNLHFEGICNECNKLSKIREKYSKSLIKN